MKLENTENVIIKIKKGLFDEIKVTNGDDAEFDQACSKFFETMKKEVIKFESSRKSKYEEWIKEKINQKEIYFESEHVTKQSPITIIDAPWGTGKTYFVERIIKFFNKNKKDRFFKKIIFLDGWKYSTSKNVPNDLISAFILAMKNIDSELASNLDKYEADENTKMVVDYDELSKCLINFDRTIVFIDNIERLGKDAWEILKGIWRLSETNNFLFVLPMNQSQLDKSISGYSGESFFEKYIDIKYIKFSQDYLGLLLSMGFSEEISKNLNEFLNVEIDGQTLSIREVKKRLEANNLLEKSKKDEYLMLSNFTNKIWGSRKMVKNYVTNDLNSFIVVLNQMNIYFDKIKNIVFELSNEIACDLEYDKIYYCGEIDFDFDFSENPISNWQEIWKKICTSLELEIKIINKNLKQLNNDVVSLQKSIEDLNKKIDIINENISINDEKQRLEIQKGESDSYVSDSNQVALLLSALKMDRKQKQEAESNVSERHAELANKKNLIITAQDDVSKISEAISLIKINNNEFNSIKIDWLNKKIENKKLWDEFKKILKSEEEISYNDENFIDKFANWLLKI